MDCANQGPAYSGSSSSFSSRLLVRSPGDFTFTSHFQCVGLWIKLGQSILLGTQIFTTYESSLGYSTADILVLFLHLLFAGFVFKPEATLIWNGGIIGYYGWSRCPGCFSHLVCKLKYNTEKQGVSRVEAVAKLPDCKSRSEQSCSSSRITTSTFSGSRSRLLPWVWLKHFLAG